VPDQVTFVAACYQGAVDASGQVVGRLGDKGTGYACPGLGEGAARSLGVRSGKPLKLGVKSSMQTVSRTVASCRCFWVSPPVRPPARETMSLVYQTKPVLDCLETWPYIYDL
jgi:hypothetical protein